MILFDSKYIYALQLSTPNEKVLTGKSLVNQSNSGRHLI